MYDQDNKCIEQLHFKCFPLGPCHTSGLAANKPLQFCSGQTARLTWKERPGRFSSRFAVASRDC